MTHRIVRTALLAWLAVLPAATVRAQTDQSRVMGVVTDESGAALPGVTVTVAGPRAQAIVTDGTGRYMSAWMAPGSYTITFVLSGFETRVVKSIPLAAGNTVVLDQQLPLAQITETVQVTAPAPPPPPPPSPVPPPRHQTKPVPREILASVCGPRKSTNFSQAVGHIVSHYDTSRRLLGPGDSLKIDAGEASGVVTGLNLVVRRRFQIGDRNVPKKQQQFGEQTAGLVQIVETRHDSSVGVVVYACGEIMAGDTVEPYVPQPAFFAVADGTPRFDDPGRITLGEYGRKVGTEGQMMVIDRGIMQGAERGQRLTIFRHGNQGRPLPVGDAVIVAIRADSATILIGRTTDAITVGDMVALHR